MRRLFCLIAMNLLGIACSKGLQVGGADAGRDSGPVDCVDPAPETCGYACQNGRWVRIPLLCLGPDGAVPDNAIPDSATPDSPIPDGAGPDSALPDSALPDSALPDSAAPDSAAPDSAAPDSATPDVLGKDTNVFEARVTDTNGTTLDGADARNDSGTPAGCENLAREWLLAGSCIGPHATFNGTFVATMDQAGCKLTFTQTDDNTPTQWIATGVLEGNGRGYLKGDFGFTDSGMCDITVTTATTWDMVCASATQQCKLQARTIPDLY